MSHWVTARRARISRRGGPRSYIPWLPLRGDSSSAGAERWPQKKVATTERRWRAWRDSNPRPLASEASTLSTELQARACGAIARDGPCWRGSARLRRASGRERSRNGNGFRPLPLQTHGRSRRRGSVEQCLHAILACFPTRTFFALSQSIYALPIAAIRTTPSGALCRATHTLRRSRHRAN